MYIEKLKKQTDLKNAPWDIYSLISINEATDTTMSSKIFKEKMLGWIEVSKIAILHLEDLTELNWIPT